MKKASLSTREIVMIIFLVILLGAVMYYMLFLTPLKEDLASIESDISNIQTQKEANTEKLSQMNNMERELKKLKEQNDLENLSQIPVYDNTVEVLASLNQYLEVNCLTHSLDFQTPEIAEDGTVRRVVEMTFECKDYASARTIIDDLTGNKWRCLVGDTTLATVEENTDLKNSVVSVQLDITFFEISKSAPTEE